MSIAFSGLLAVTLLAVAPAETSPPEPVVSPDFSGVISTTITLPGTAGAVGVSSSVFEGVGPGCTWTASEDLNGQLGAAVLAAEGGEAGSDAQAARSLLRGRFFVRACTDGTSTPVWVPDDPGQGAPPGVAVVSPALLAQDIRNTMQLPRPTFGYNPNPQVSKIPPLVNLPTWWWITSDPQPLTQRTALGGVWAQVRATPTATRWISSDGQVQDCVGMGVAWRAGLPEDTAGHCAFTYRRPHESETATVQVLWDVQWSGSGGSGGSFEPLAMSTQITTPVYERHALITEVNPGGLGEPR